ncbi:hypothetical protein CDO29_36020 (plasmid) [Sinorhizobium meliloti]|nr:hypothetical protein CDO29_36020 [Sinorhizobium meliloti]
MELIIPNSGAMVIAAAKAAILNLASIQEDLPIIAAYAHAMENRYSLCGNAELVKANWRLY